MMVYPYRDRADKSASGWNRKAVRIITHWMPILMLPLLLLMSIGIARRISDYGITILRVYLVAFNLWCYAVCVVLILKRNAGILWIPVSLVLTFALLTLLPVNVSTSVRKSLTAKIDSTLKSNGWDGTAMDDDTYGKFISTLDADVSHRLDSRIDYLKSQFSRKSVSAFIETGVLTGRVPEAVQDQEADSTLNINRYRHILGETSFSLPANASSMSLYQTTVDIDQNSIKEDILTVQLPVSWDNKELMYELRIPMQQLRALEKEITTENIAKGDINHIISYIGTLVGNNADAPARVTLYLNTFQLYYSGKKGYFTIAGPLFW